ncbi:hypothetical protein AQJ27_44160 [Streptomyces olivochromogenes]|nr:hypothetical protein AQJ27_44160 [Streptomyces olivochromogenes]
MQSLVRLGRRHGDQPGHRVLQVCDRTDTDRGPARDNDHEQVLECFHHFQQSSSCRRLGITAQHFAYTLH